MKSIPLRERGGGVRANVFVDDRDYEWLNQWRWSLHVGYASRFNPNLPHRIYMHRLILGLEFGDGKQGDHINRDRLDNRRANLRIVAPAGNYLNHPGLGGTSRHRGVSWYKSRKKWRAQIYIANRSYSLGYHEREEDAAAAVRTFLLERGLPEAAL